MRLRLWPSKPARTPNDSGLVLKDGTFVEPTPKPRQGWMRDARFIGVGPLVRGQVTHSTLRVEEIGTIGRLSQIKVIEVVGYYSKTDRESTFNLMDKTFVLSSRIDWDDDVKSRQQQAVAQSFTNGYKAGFEAGKVARS